MSFCTKMPSKTVAAMHKGRNAASDSRQHALQSRLPTQTASRGTFESVNNTKDSCAEEGWGPIVICLLRTGKNPSEQEMPTCSKTAEVRRQAPSKPKAQTYSEITSVRPHILKHNIHLAAKREGFKIRRSDVDDQRSGAAHARTSRS